MVEIVADTLSEVWKKAQAYVIDNPETYFYGPFKSNGNGKVWKTEYIMRIGIMSHEQKQALESACKAND